MSWNGLVVRGRGRGLPGRARSGVAIGLQQTRAERPRRGLPAALRRARRAPRRGGSASPPSRLLPLAGLARPASIARVTSPRAPRRDLRDRAASRRLLGRGGRRARARGRLDARGGARGRASTRRATCSAGAARRASGPARISTASRPPAASTARSASSPRSRRRSGCPTRRSPSSPSATRRPGRWAAGVLAGAAGRRSSSCTSSRARCSSALGEPLGIVTAIAGQARGEVVFEGRADHAGTTPMDARDDALVEAARVHPARPRRARGAARSPRSARSRSSRTRPTSCRRA